MKKRKGRNHQLWNSEAEGLGKLGNNSVESFDPANTTKGFKRQRINASLQTVTIPTPTFTEEEEPFDFDKTLSEIYLTMKSRCEQTEDFLHTMEQTGTFENNEIKLEDIVVSKKLKEQEKRKKKSRKRLKPNACRRCRKKKEKCETMPGKSKCENCLRAIRRKNADPNDFPCIKHMDGRTKKIKKLLLRAREVWERLVKQEEAKLKSAAKDAHTEKSKILQSPADLYPHMMNPNKLRLPEDWTKAQIRDFIERYDYLGGGPTFVPPPPDFTYNSIIPNLMSKYRCCIERSFLRGDEGLKTKNKNKIENKLENVVEFENKIENKLENVVEFENKIENKLENVVEFNAKVVVFVPAVVLAVAETAAAAAAVVVVVVVACSGKVFMRRIAVVTTTAAVSGCAFYNSTLMKGRNESSHVNVPERNLPPGCMTCLEPPSGSRTGMPSSLLAWGSATYNANDPLEDRHGAMIESDLAIFGVFDGHGGWQVADFVSQHIFNTIADNIRSNDDGDESSSLQRAFEDTDKLYIKKVYDAFKLGFERTSRVGACGLVLVVGEAGLLVANAGDCRAVLGQKGVTTTIPSLDGENTTGLPDSNLDVRQDENEMLNRRLHQWSALSLSNDHSANSLRCQEELAKKHPGEDNIVVCKRPGACYIKGKLMPARGFGDLYLKDANFNGPKYTPLYGRVRGRHIPEPYTPPYVTVCPETTIHLFNLKSSLIGRRKQEISIFLKNETLDSEIRNNSEDENFSKENEDLTNSDSETLSIIEKLSKLGAGVSAPTLQLPSLTWPSASKVFSLATGTGEEENWRPNRSVTTGNSDGSFVIMGSDGLWDELTNEEAVGIVAQVREALDADIAAAVEAASFDVDVPKQQFQSNHKNLSLSAPSQIDGSVDVEKTSTSNASRSATNAVCTDGHIITDVRLAAQRAAQQAAERLVTEALAKAAARHAMPPQVLKMLPPGRSRRRDDSMSSSDESSKTDSHSILSNFPGYLQRLLPLPSKNVEEFGKLFLSRFLSGTLYNDPDDMSPEYQQCYRECRWKYGFFDRSITGIRTGAFGNDNSWGLHCRCLRNGEKIPGDDIDRTSTKPWDDSEYWCGPGDGTGFKTPYVCVLDSSVSIGYKTTTRKDAAARSETILHCGKCSACSHPDDMKVLYNTRHNITTDLTACSTKFARPELLNGDHSLSHLKQCMRESGVTFDDTRRFSGPNGPNCMECWTDNIMCDVVQCWSNPDCLKKFIDPTNPGALAGCVKCDETHCGAEFIKCAGANRRSSGIRSDITRTGDQVCTVGFYFDCSECHRKCGNDAGCNARCEELPSCKGPSISTDENGKVELI
eukprot:g4774.t1